MRRMWCVPATAGAGALSLLVMACDAFVRYIGAVWDGADTIQTPGYTLYDAMAAWENKNWRFQLNGTNLTDKVYFTACLTRGDCFYGNRRSVLASLTYKF